MYVCIYSYGLNEEACCATQSFILFKQSSDIHFIYLFSKTQKEKSNKILANTPEKIFYQRNTKIASLYYPSQISKAIYVYVDSYLLTQNVC